jgi:hypothetical protein
MQIFKPLLKVIFKGAKWCKEFTTNTVSTIPLKIKDKQYIQRGKEP